MCGIAGWVAFKRDLRKEFSLIEKMTATLASRGPDGSGIWANEHIALGHRRLAVIDPLGGRQPFLTPELTSEGQPMAVLSYNGEVYNFSELKKELEAKGHSFRTLCDTEVILRGYLEWGEQVVDRLNGIFAFAIWDERKQELFLVRDRLGVKPLYYYPTPDGILFGSEPKAILANPLAQAQAGIEEFRDALLFLRTPGRVPLRGMSEVKPGHWLKINNLRRTEQPYWRLEAKAHEHNLTQTIQHVRELLEGSVQRQLVSDVPICSLLSGGLDSSAVAALAQKSILARNQSPLKTFVVDFTLHTANFQADPIRPSPDAPFSIDVAEHIGSRHQVVTLNKLDLLNPYVRQKVLSAWDLPFNFGDLDISLYLLFAEIKTHATVALSGEGADELFGGYLWFSDPLALQTEAFPWLKLGAHRGIDPSKLFNETFTKDLALDTYLADLYADAKNEVLHLDGESVLEHRQRELSYLTLTRWLPILLDKKDRMSMAVGLEGRVPFCDHRLVEYVYNIPWAMKNSFSLEKGILREAVKDLLPLSVLRRKKAAYPSVQDRGYDSALLNQLSTQASENDSNLGPLLWKDSIRDLQAKVKLGPLSEFERITVETTTRVGDWIKNRNVILT